MFGTGPIQMAQTFFIAEGFTQTSERLAPTLDKLNAGVEFGKMNLINWNIPMELPLPWEVLARTKAVVTNGLSSLVTPT